jgi:hypothetical protein
VIAALWCVVLSLPLFTLGMVIVAIAIPVVVLIMMMVVITVVVVITSCRLCLLVLYLRLGGGVEESFVGSVLAYSALGEVK